VLYKIVSEDPLPAQHLNPTLAWAVAMVLGRSLSKDPAKRYPTCTEFVVALEAALKTKKGWKPLARGSSQNLPTEVMGAPIGLTTTQRNARVKSSGRRSLLWPILALLMAMLGVAGVIVWFGHWRPWERQPERQPPEQVVAPAGPTASVPRPSPTLPMPAPLPPEAKPTQPLETTAVKTTAPAQPKPPALQPLQVVTDPPGAKVVLDEDSTRTCQSPCSFQLDSQRHTLAFNLAGYRAELRILPPSRQPQELFVPLTRMVGTVMVMADALGAQILVDGKPIPETTPAKLTLPAGKYNLSVLKDGHRADQEIEIKDGSLLKFTLQLNP
jgi:hypothetical protein